MKRRIFITAVIVICLSLLAYGTLAYFTAEDIAHNVITSGAIHIKLLEWKDEAKTTPFPEEGIHGVMPGTDITKIVEVKNTGSNSAWIRVKVEKEIVLTDGSEPDLGLMTLDFDETSWEYKDGYYYYNEALEPGEVTAPLFATVSFDADMGNAYQNSTASVKVTAYATQVANNGNSAVEAAGWPED